MAEEPKLIPQVTPELKPFFDAAREHKLAVQKCDKCGKLRFPAAALCLACDSDKASWVPVSGRGEVFSFTIMHRAYHPAIKVPYTLAVIELKEGVKITSNVIDIEPSKVKCGMPVEVTFEKLSDEVTLPKFRPAAH
ncbi:MAG: Zn-ribbon domain-containing OB-fold protein [Candidatus Binataceae bacterium]